MPRAPALVLLALACGNRALPPSCYTAGSDDAFVQCGYCSTPDLSYLQDGASLAALCGQAGSPLPPPPPHAALVSTLVAALLNTSQIQGVYFLDEPGGLEENATEALTYLLDTMPRRDWLQLFAAPLSFSDFLVEHVRYALYAYHTYSAALGVTWADFLDAVLPFATLNEKRDVAFRWRPRFYATLAPLLRASNATTVLGAFRVVVAAMPTLQLGGVYALTAAGGPSAANETLAPGAPISWRSESSPARLSVQDTVQFGASCTGTATTMAMAARSVGLPARVVGCSESVVRGDDHHWLEVRDWSAPGPFGTHWHTREGASAGNADGPWDAPSGPMLGCLQGVVPGSSLDTLWATSWGSTTNLPTLWANDARSALWARIGGVNVCGDYCTAWGCGANNSQRWTQAQCGPTAA